MSWEGGGGGTVCGGEGVRGRGELRNTPGESDLPELNNSLVFVDLLLVDLMHLVFTCMQG